jgi:hypothetical protein
MIRNLIRHLAPLLVVLSILAPMGGAAMGQLFGDARMIVICTGDGLQTLTLDANGTPIKSTESAEICALVHANDTAQGATPTGLSTAEFSALARPDAQHIAPPAAPALLSLPRAPPRA